MNALEIVASGIQKSNLSLPQQLQDENEVRRVLRWKFAYQHKVIRDNAITKSKRNSELLSGQPSQRTRRGVSLPSIDLASRLEIVEEHLTSDLRRKIEQVSDTGLLALPANIPICHNSRQPPCLDLISTPTSPRKLKSIPTFFCIAAHRTPQQYIEDYSSIAIRCPAEDLLEDRDMHRMYDRVNMTAMKKRYGHGYANYDTTVDPPVPVIHQDLATGYLLQDLGSTVIFETWAWIHKQAQLLENPDSRCVKQARAFRPGDHSSVFLLHPGPLDARLRRSYTALETQVHRSPRSLAIFPALTELEHTCQKTGDLAALDELATGKHYRPKTCLIGKGRHHFPHDGCCLNGEQRYVAKRNNSSCSMHVYEMENVISVEPRRDSSCAELPLGLDRWFYQERLSFLKDIGEFRVFMTTTSGSGGIRGRYGTHLHSIFTKPRRTPGFAAFALDDYFWSQNLAAHFAPLTQDDLHAFALEVYEGLRARGDWKTYYESLDIGVRLDIGVSSDRRFFVNEITRIWCGDFFSDQTLAEPKRKIVWAVARALHEYFQ